jgi:peptidyl-tRNA hydrolase, PTH1 family
MREKLILGLGNPEPFFYQRRHNDDFALLKAMQAFGHFNSPNETPHNAGFRVVRAVAGKAPFYYDRKLPGEEAAIHVRNASLVMVCPMTGMNTCGEAAKMALALYNVQPQDMLLVYDDITLPLGQLRFQRGSDKPATGGGHNGVKSVVAVTGTNKFDRLKVGVGPLPEDVPLLEFVLGTIPEKLRPAYNAAITAAAEAAKTWASHGIDAALTACHGRTFS